MYSEIVRRSIYTSNLIFMKIQSLGNFGEVSQEAEVRESQKSV